MTNAQVEVGDRIFFSDPTGREEAFSGEVTTVFEDDAGDQVSVVVKTDDGKWATIDLMAVTVSPDVRRLH